MKTHFLVFLLLLLSSQGATAHVRARFIGVSSNSVVKELKNNLEIEYSLQEPTPVYLRYEILSEDGAIILQAKSTVFSLQPGSTIIRPGDLPLEILIEPQEDLVGRYVVCAYIYSLRSEQLLVQVCQYQDFGSFVRGEIPSKRETFCS
ncbi:MAG: hypothetical protein AAF357_07740 [Verrucomicrobiota bacterium]